MLMVNVLHGIFRARFSFHVTTVVASFRTAAAEEWEKGD
jgi:hypothetical protein